MFNLFYCISFCERRSRLTKSNNFLLAPLVLLLDLLLLIRCEVGGNVEGLADLLRLLTLDHVGHGLAGQVQEGLDVQIIGSQDELEEEGLLNLAELLIPLQNVVCATIFYFLLMLVLRLLRPGQISGSENRVLMMVLHILQNLGKGLARNIRQGNGTRKLAAQILNHVEYSHGKLGHPIGDFKLLLIIRNKLQKSGIRDAILLRCLSSLRGSGFHDEKFN